MNMMYEVFVYNSYFQRRDGEKVFSKIQEPVNMDTNC